MTVNKVCLSGLDAIALADQLIRAGEFDIVVAGGMESMTNAPHLLMGQRHGYKYGDIVVRDHMAFDGLIDPWDCFSMGESTERTAPSSASPAPSRTPSPRSATSGPPPRSENGHFAEEIVAGQGPASARSTR